MGHPGPWGAQLDGAAHLDTAPAGGSCSWMIWLRGMRRGRGRSRIRAEGTVPRRAAQDGMVGGMLKSPSELSFLQTCSVAKSTAEKRWVIIAPKHPTTNPMLRGAEVTGKAPS